MSVKMVDSQPLRLVVIADFAEEGWPSMDLCADMLLSQLPALPDTSLAVARLCPAFRKRFGWLPGLGRRSFTFNADRLCNRHWDYPRYLRGHLGDFDFFHLVDHSYAHLVRELPAARTGVYCHDLDAFRCLLRPDLEPRPFWFRWLARRKLDGLRRAAVVFHTTQAVRQEILRHGLVEPGRLVHAPNGVCLEFTAEARADDGAAVPFSSGEPFLLHVGSCIPRKRIDVLLNVFQALRTAHPSLRLVQVGGPWTQAQQRQRQRLAIEAVTFQVSGLERRALAALYRQAACVLLPSEAEGFGLPVIEALACGSAVVASDLPVLREVGGEAVRYCGVGDIAGWVETVAGILDGRVGAGERGARLAQAGRYSWRSQAQTIAGAYLRLAEGKLPGGEV